MRSWVQQIIFINEVTNVLVIGNNDKPVLPKKYKKANISQGRKILAYVIALAFSIASMAILLAVVPEELKSGDPPAVALAAAPIAVVAMFIIYKIMPEVFKTQNA